MVYITGYNAVKIFTGVFPKRVSRRKILILFGIFNGEACHAPIIEILSIRKHSFQSTESI